MAALYDTADYRLSPFSIRSLSESGWELFLIFKKRRRCVWPWGVKGLLDKIPYEDAVSIKQQLIGHFGKTKYYRFYREERYLTPKEQAYIRQVFCNKGITEEPPFTRYTDEYMW